MKIGIDGNQWYCSNGLCLGDIRANFVFAGTLREAVDVYKAEFGSLEGIPQELAPYMDMTVDAYNTAQYGGCLESASTEHEEAEALARVHAESIREYDNGDLIDATITPEQLASLIAEVRRGQAEKDQVAVEQQQKLRMSQGLNTPAVINAYADAVFAIRARLEEGK